MGVGCGRTYGLELVEATQEVGNHAHCRHSLAVRLL